MKYKAKTRYILMSVFTGIVMSGCGSDDGVGAEPWTLSELGEEEVQPPKMDPPKKDPPIKDPPTPPKPSHDERFVGIWMVHDNVPRGGITAEVFQFHPDGRLELLRQFDPAGVVVNCALEDQMCSPWNEDVLRCNFGQRWSSDGPTSLMIESDCNDDQTRTITLSFPEDQSSNSIGQQGTTASLISVGGQTEGWSASSFAGPANAIYFLRCEQAELCQLP